MDNEVKEIKEQIKDLLLDDNFTMLESAQPAFNPFDVLRIARTEIRHSNVLAWLLDPNESHELGDVVLKKLCMALCKINVFDNDTAVDLLTMEHSSVVVFRELYNTDLLIVSEEYRIVICIENKIDTQDHDRQLDRYVNIVESQYPSFTKVFIYLSPDGRAPQEVEKDVWICLSYKTIMNIIEDVRKEAAISDGVNSFICSYEEILRREIVGNREIEEICQSIYNKHKEVLDLIFNNRPDKLSNFYELVKAWCKRKTAEIEFYEDKSNKSSAKFLTAKIKELIKDSNEISGWGTKNHYFYEIDAYIDNKDAIKYSMLLSFSSANLEPENKSQLEKIDALIQPKKTAFKENWQWRRAYRTTPETIQGNEDLPDIDDEDNKVYKALDKMLAKIQNMELDLEKALKAEEQQANAE